MPLEEHAAMPLAGGIVTHGYQCGQLWGAALAAGAQAYRLVGTGPQAEAAAVIAAQRIVESFRARNHEINCFELTEGLIKNPSAKKILNLFIKRGPTLCFGIAARFASSAFGDINTALAENHIAALSRPVSCAALLAKKMGASDLHTIMAAGFAGGIGLSGSACGALGAAIWLTEMNWGRAEGADKLKYESPRALALVERFLESADYEFECSKIVGRKFEDVNDHADHLYGGGCSKIIAALAAA